MDTFERIDPGHSSGRIRAEKSPDSLEIWTASPLSDSAFRPISKGDDLYPVFVQAWQQEPEWDNATHLAYWLVALRIWPVRKGQRRVQELYGLCAWSWRNGGIADEEIARRLGLAGDSLRRRDAFAYADMLAEQPAKGVDEWRRAPLIVAPDIETPPRSPLDGWVNPQLAQLARAPVAGRHREIMGLFADCGAPGG